MEVMELQSTAIFEDDISVAIANGLFISTWTGAAAPTEGFLSRSRCSGELLGRGVRAGI
jgi:hypothetical protein